jgi:hypothetical protein
MKPYGSDNPHVRSAIDWGECASVKASKRKLGRNGDLHNTVRKVEQKAALRRIEKRIARRVGKAACKDF